MTPVDVIDYGAGNLTSVLKALRSVGADPRLAQTPAAIATSTALVVPGVGHFAATAALDQPWRDAITARLTHGASLLGICLGMQWLFDGSEEAPDLPGLGLFPGRCFRLPNVDGVKVPHVGWNSLERTTDTSPILADVPNEAYAYFTHTYAGPVTDATIATTSHGVPFASVIGRDRIFGAQWHPEKSGAVGLACLTSFIRIASEAR
jgi:glutamine amidotransferase